MLRLRHIISGLVLAAVVAASSLPGLRATAQTPPPTNYLKNFDNIVSPEMPLPLTSDATFDVYAHSRNRDTWAGLDPMEIQHGAHCEAPPAAHPSSQPMSYAEASFICAANPHWMTAIRGDGYAAIYGTPNHLVDFSSGEAVIRFDVSTFRTSTRDWLDVWVTPYEGNIPGPLSSGLPALAGEPQRAVTLGLGANSNWFAQVIRNYTEVTLPGDMSTGYQTFLVPSASRRDTVEVRLSRDHIKVGMPAYNFFWVDTAINPPLDWDRGIVQFGHHSYTPWKDCPTGQTCGPNTWHWDNFSISPSVPFTMIRSIERSYLEPSQGAAIAIAFPQPAPPGAYLRLNFLGAGQQVSLDGGTTWTPLQLQPSKKGGQDGILSPFWHPVPAGTQGVQVRSTTFGGWGQSYVEYASIWADTVGQIPTPTAQTPTPTPVATEAPTATPQMTLSPLPTFTPVPQPPTVTAIVAATHTAIVATATSVAATSTAIVATATAHAATATAVSTLAGTPAPLGNCTVTVAANRKSGSWSCP